MRKLSGHQCKLKMSGSKKKVNKNTYDISSIKRVTRKCLEVSRCSRAKRRQRNVRKSVQNMQSCFFAINQRPVCCVFTVLVSFAAQHYTILYFVSANYKYRALLLTLAKSLYFGHASINTDNGLFPVSRVTNSHISSIPLYRHTYQRIPYQNGE